MAARQPAAAVPDPAEYKPATISATQSVNTFIVSSQVKRVARGGPWFRRFETPRECL